jgi:hypothetical protein
MIAASFRRKTWSDISQPENELTFQAIIVNSNPVRPIARPIRQVHIHVLKKFIVELKPGSFKSGKLCELLRSFYSRPAIWEVW